MNFLRFYFSDSMHKPSVYGLILTLLIIIIAITIITIVLITIINFKLTYFPLRILLS